MAKNEFFSGIEEVRYLGPDTEVELAYRHYRAEEKILEKTMTEHLRASVCYWHSFCWPGQDPFGGQTFDRPWFGDSIEDAKNKADVAFDLFRILGVPYFCFHDADIRPEGENYKQSVFYLAEMVDYFLEKMMTSSVKVLWGTTNLFTHKRFMAGAATNPDPEVFAYAGALVKACMDATHRLGGENYVLWGGREGYESILNTNFSREIEQLGRFLSMVVEYKHKIGFTGTILVEPKPREPSKQQYDFDVASVYGFLKRFHLENEVKVNIEQGHSLLAGHSFEHEITLAQALGIFGSIDMNRNDVQSGWDTDQFPNNVSECALAYYPILKAGGFSTGGTNLDTKLRRQSIEPEDLVAAHVGAIDVCARSIKAAARMLEEGGLERALEKRYSGWGDEWAQRLLTSSTLEDLEDLVVCEDLEPSARSGRQEILENYVNRFV